MIAVMYRYNNRWGYFDQKRKFFVFDPEEAGTYILNFLKTMSDPKESKTPKGRKKVTDKNVLYITDLDLIGSYIHKNLINDYTDLTGKMDRKKKLQDGGYSYLISGDMGRWFGMTVQNGKTTNSIYALENIIPHLSNDEILKSKLNNEEDLRTLCRVSLSIISKLISMCENEAMTISSFAMKRWQSFTKVFDRGCTFPDMYRVDCDLYGCSVDDYLRPAYKGGWCYVNADTTKTYKNGITLDVNSLYPYVMRFRKYPVGYPRFWVGEIPREYQKYISKGIMMSFYHISCKFKVKPGFLPFVQIPGDFFRQGVLSESKYHTSQGHIVDEPVDLTFTEWELKLFLKHYDVSDYMVLDGCCFYLSDQVFKLYVDEYYQMKKESKLKGDLINASVAKFMMNALSGNLAKKRNKDNCILNSDGYISSVINTESRGKSHIQLASCITSYARCMMVELAQNNYKRFLYCDTDSLHLSGTNVPEKIHISDTELGEFKIEREWQRAHFYKAKVYIEQDKSGEFSVTYAGCPHEVQKQIEDYLNGMSTMYTFFGETPQEINLKEVKIDNLRYTNETPSGTMKPDVQHALWHIDIPEREQKEMLKLRKLRARAI